MTTRSKSLLLRLALSALSAAIASLAGLWVYRSLSSGVGPAVEVLDHSKEFQRELERRQEEKRAEGETNSEHTLYLPTDKAAFSEYMKKLVPKSLVYDPILFKRWPSHSRREVRHSDHPEGGWQENFNDYGMRNERDVATAPPEVRVLVTGDSHTQGAVSTPETFCAVLEGLLGEGRPAGAAEVLNAGVSSYNLYHYLGVAERYLEELKPQVFMIVVYGGNDFAPSAKLHRYFARRGRYESKPHERTPYLPALRDRRTMLTQQLSQVFYFMNNPGDEDVAKDIVVSVSDQIAKLCAKTETTPFFVYLPPGSYGQPELYRDTVQDLTQRGELTERDLAVSERIADTWLDALAASGLASLDLRDVYRGVDQSLYWNSDQHINVLGNQLAAQAMEKRIRELLE